MHPRAPPSLFPPSFLSLSLSLLSLSHLSFLILPSSYPSKFPLSPSLPRGTHLRVLATVKGLRQTRAAVSEPMGLWEAPRRGVEVDGGMRAKGLAFWLAGEHKIDMSKVELRQSPLEAQILKSLSNFLDELG